MPVFNLPKRTAPLKSVAAPGSTVKPMEYCWPGRSFMPAKRHTQLDGRGESPRRNLQRWRCFESCSACFVS